MNSLSPPKTDFFRSLALVVITVGLFFIVLDLGLRAWLFKGNAAAIPVDIQSPSVLSLKLEELGRFEGKRVVLLGDSLIFGQAMAIHGDNDWREHTLDAVLRRRLEQVFPDSKVLVLNLGINGVLPCDLSRMVDMVLDYSPDLIIMDINLRAFSSDFQKKGGHHARPWLAEMRGPWDLVTGDMTPGLAQRYWTLYRARDFLQTLVLGSNPEEFAKKVRSQLTDSLKPKNDSSTGPIDDTMVLLMKAKKRYSRITLTADNPQVEALKVAMKQLNKAGQSTLLFYAVENPEQLPFIISGKRYQSFLSDLEKIIGQNTGSQIRFIRPDNKVLTGNYLDQIHVDALGYQMLADELWPVIKELLDL